MPGKLKAVIAATTPIGWRIIISSMPRATSFQVVTLHHHRNAAGNFHVFYGAAKFGFRFAERFAIFKGDQATEFIKGALPAHF